MNLICISGKQFTVSIITLQYNYKLKTTFYAFLDYSKKFTLDPPNHVNAFL